jgi:hypothetical protein
MVYMGDEEMSTPRHLVILEDEWVNMREICPAEEHYEGTVHNLHIECDVDDDGTALNTEHSYTLANGLVVHNILTSA